MTASHPLLFTRIKLQDGPVTAICFSPNGQYFASCSTDRSVLLFNTTQLQDKDKKCVCQDPALLVFNSLI